MALKRGIVKLEDYNSNWVEEYELEEKLLKEVLGDKIIEINHVGSTSIPGLKAKHIIDISVVIDDLKNIKEIEDILVNYDYENRGKQGIEDRCFFPKGPDDGRTHYIHFTEKNSNTYIDQVYFKRYLIDHKDYLKKYCELKEALALKYKDERPKYTKGKSDFIKEVINLAIKEYGIKED